jgi:hypothetical protein
MASLADTLAAAVAPSQLPLRHRLPRSAAAMEALQPPLTPQERNLYDHHLYNMRHGKWIDQGGGTFSTVIQRNEDGGDFGGLPGRAYSFPSVWNGKELKGDALYDAVQPMSQWPNYGDTYIPGASLSSYDNADARYLGQMHDPMAADVMSPEAYHQYLQSLNR